MKQLFILIFSIVLISTISFAVIERENIQAYFDSKQHLKEYEDAKETSSRFEKLLLGQYLEETKIEITCSNNPVYTYMYVQCETEYWGRWEVYWNVNGNLRLLWSTLYNDSTGGGPFTTDPGSLVVVFFHLDGRIQEYNYNMNSDMKLCVPENSCQRISY